MLESPHLLSVPRFIVSRPRANLQRPGETPPAELNPPLMRFHVLAKILVDLRSELESLDLSLVSLVDDREMDLIVVFYRRLTVE